MSQSKPVHENSGGSIRIADGTNFPASPKLVSAHLNIPGDTLARFPRGGQGMVPLA